MTRSNSRLEDYKSFPLGFPATGQFYDPDCLGYVYVIGFEEPGIVKIGSAKGIASRVAGLQCGNPFELKLRAAVAIYDRDPVLIEFAAHRLAAEHLIRGEWFSLDEDEALKIVIRAARNAKARFGAHAIALANFEAREEARKLASATTDEDERRRVMRVKLGME